VRPQRADRAVAVLVGVRDRPLHAAGLRDRQVGLRPPAAAQRRRLMDARCFTVGPVAENTWIARRDGETRALLIDPGDEAERLEDAIAALGVTIEAILITHCHFDHIGAVAALARATGAPVCCPRAEVPMLRDPNSYTWPG